MRFDPNFLIEDYKPTSLNSVNPTKKNSILVNYSSKNRASIEDFDMPRARRKGSRRKTKKSIFQIRVKRSRRGRRRQSRTTARGVRIVGNKVAIRLGTSRKSEVKISPSALVKKIPLKPLRAAAKKILKYIKPKQVKRRKRRRTTKRRRIAIS